jgi:aquaporin Z
MIASGVLRRALLGIAIGTTVVVIVTTPWGKRSGGHFNPAITLTYFRMGKLRLWDAVFYIAAQFSGAICGVVIATYALGGTPQHVAVRYAVTVPGMYGKAAAFAAELMISFVLFITILFVSTRGRIAQYTPYFIGALYAIYITFEAPLSGMSMNPARTLGSAFPAGVWDALWIYFTAPTMGMLIAAEVFLRISGGIGPCCAKLYHANDKRCLFQHT